MPNQNLFDVVVVNWNSGSQVAECLDSIAESGIDCLGEVVVVDNASSDGSNLCAAMYSEVHFIQARKNLGFAKACNLGANQVSAPYCLFLNPDARLYKGSVDSLLRFMENPDSTDIGICGTRLVGADGKTHRHCARFPSWRTYFGKASGLSRLFPQRFPSQFMIEFDHESSREVDHVMGACFLVRRQVFEDIGWFDERFFVYLEDLDFCLRAKRAGWRTWYLAEASAYHKGGGTSEQVKAHRLFYSLRSRILYGFKHFSPAAAWTVFAVTIGIEPVTRSLRSVLRLAPREILDTLWAYKMLWQDVPTILRIAQTKR